MCSGRQEKVWDVSKNPWVQQWFRSIWREAPVRWMTWRITGIESSYFSDDKIFNVNPVFNKQVDRVVKLGNDGRVSTTSNLDSIMMLVVVAWTGRRCLRLVWTGLQAEDASGWFERDYSAVYKEVLDAKVLPWVKKITKKSDYVFQQNNGAPAHTTKTVQGWLDEHLAQRLLAFSVTTFQLSRLRLVDVHWGKVLQDMPY